MLFLLHPNITRTFLTVFQCVDISNNEARVRVDLEMICYSYQHLLWWFILGFPTILIWGIGIPLSAFILIYRNRNKLEEESVKHYYLLLYQGLKKEWFYWEFVNTSRKVLVLSINIFLSTYPLMYRLLFNIILLIGFLRLQIHLQPYKRDRTNKLERKELIAGIMSMFGGTLFIDEKDKINEINLAVFIFVVALNIHFIIYWVYWLLFALKDTHQ